MEAPGRLSLSKMRPKNAEDAHGRALFYAHSLNLYCKRAVEGLLHRCENGEFGEALQEAPSEVSEWSVSSAVKVVTCISLYLAGLQLSDPSAPWLVHFLFESMKEMDEYFPTPLAQEIVEEHGRRSEEDTMRDAAKHVMERLGLPPEADDAAAVISNFLATSGPYRNELLVFALTQPAEALSKHLQMLQ